MDPLSIGMGAANAVGGLASGIANIFYGGKQLELQRDQFNYQKELNEKIMQREDTAVQRRAADMAEAGINKNMAAGSPAETAALGSGNPVGTGGSAQQSQGIGAIGNSIGMAMSAMSSVEEVVNLQKQNDLMDSEELLNLSKTASEMKRKGLLDAETQRTIQEVQKMAWNQQLAQQWKLPHGQMIIPGLARESNIINQRKDGRTGGFKELGAQLMYNVGDSAQRILESAIEAKFNGRMFSRNFDDYETSGETSGRRWTHRSRRYK